MRKAEFLITILSNSATTGGASASSPRSPAPGWTPSFDSLSPASTGDTILSLFRFRGVVNEKSVEGKRVGKNKVTNIVTSDGERVE